MLVLHFWMMMIITSFFSCAHTVKSGSLGGNNGRWNFLSSHRSNDPVLILFSFFVASFKRQPSILHYIYYTYFLNLIICPKCAFAKLDLPKIFGIMVHSHSFGLWPQQLSDCTSYFNRKNPDFCPPLHKIIGLLFITCFV